VSQPRLAPALAAFAVAQGAMAIFWLRAGAGRPSPELIRVYLGVSYFGLAYLVAAVAGGPSTTRFWIILVVSLAIFAPVWLSFRRPTQ
jgi:hypothetical protein